MLHDVNLSDQLRVSYRLHAPGRRFPPFSSAPASEKFEDPHMPTPYLGAYIMSNFLVQAVTTVHELTVTEYQFLKTCR